MIVLLRTLLCFVLLPFCATWANADGLPLIEFKTPKGFAVSFYRSNVQDTVAIALAFDCGLACDDPYRPAVGQLAPSLFLEGADGKSSSELYESFQDVGGDFSISSTPDQTYAAISAPSKGIDGAVALANLVFRKPDFPMSRFIRKRETVAQRIEEASTYPEFRLQKAFFETAFDKHPYVKSMLPEAADIRSITHSDILKWRESHLALNGIIISVVGKIDQTQAGILVDRLLDGLPAKSNLPPVPKINFKSVISNPIQVKGDKGDQAILTMGNAYPRDIALKDWLAGNMLSTIFSGDQKSRLFKVIREANGASYGLQPSINFFEAMGSNSVSGRVSKVALESTIDITLKAWRTFRVEGPTPSEVENAKANQLNVLNILSRNHVQLAGTIRDYRTGHWSTAELAGMANLIRGVNLNDPAVLKRYFSENPIIVVAQ